jgi:hypothetical protein
MNSLLLAAMLTQFIPAATDQEIGAVNTLYSTALAVQAGTRTITRNAAKTRVCVKFAGLGSAAPGSVTVRAGVVVMSVAVQQRLGMALPSGATSWLDATEQYGVLEIQAVPANTATFDPRLILQNFDVIRNEVELRPSPVDATCEVAIARADDATFGTSARCACALSSLCKAADGVTAAPIGTTLSARMFTPSAACQPKPCVARFDGVGVDKTWPAVCPK